MTRRSLLTLSLLLLSGCGEFEEHAEQGDSTPFGPVDTEYVTMIVFDMSGSFEQIMADHGYEFAMHVLDRNFRGRVGTDDKLVIVQISGTQRSLLWEGKAVELRQDFGSADSFRDFLKKKAAPGSLVHDSIRSAVEYVMADAAVASGKAKTSLFVLSDMMDTGSDAAETERKLVSALTDLARLKSVVGLYFVDTLEYPRWNRNLRNAGFSDDRFRVTSEINGRPPLPNFEN